MRVASFGTGAGLGRKCAKALIKKLKWGKDRSRRAASKENQSAEAKEEEGRLKGRRPKSQIPEARPKASKRRPPKTKYHPSKVLEAMQEKYKEI